MRFTLSLLFPRESERIVDQIVDVPSLGTHPGTDADEIVEVIPLKLQERIQENMVKHTASLGTHPRMDADRLCLRRESKSTSTLWASLGTHP